MRKVSLILGFFDGVHAGHRKVIKTAVDYAKENNLKTILLRPDIAPAEIFGKSFSYIFPRNRNFELIHSLGVDEIKPIFMQDSAKTSAADFLSEIVNKYNPASITTGFNHTFGANKSGDSKLLEVNQEPYGYKYFCVEPCIIDDNLVSSTYIKQQLLEDKLEYANKLLNSSFYIEGIVQKGNQLGRKLGFPTANLTYPEKLVKIPYGVYKVKANNKPAILNWGIRPTIEGRKEVLEVHIPNYEANLYNLPLKIEFIKKIRDERKFATIEELKEQISKDVEECLKL